MIKKIVVNRYEDDGKFRLKMTLTTKKAIVADSFAAAKKAVAQVVQMSVVGMNRYTVEWKREGSPEGYMVIR